MFNLKFKKMKKNLMMTFAGILILMASISCDKEVPVSGVGDMLPTHAEFQGKMQPIVDVLYKDDGTTELIRRFDQKVLTIAKKGQTIESVMAANPGDYAFSCRCNCCQIDFCTAWKTGCITCPDHNAHKLTNPVDLSPCGCGVCIIVNVE